MARVVANLGSEGFPSDIFYGRCPTRLIYERLNSDIGVSIDVTDNRTNDTLELFRLKNSFINRMNDIYHREDERIKTFDRWPLEWMDKFQLAQTGMFYTGEEDKVKCYFCEVEIGRWEREDEPVPEHLRWSPNCPLLRRRTTNNVPISSEALDRVLPPISYDICGANDAIEVRPNSFPESVNRSQNYSERTEGNINSSNTTVAAYSGECQTTYFPEYPEYAIESARLRSFAEWPRNMKQKPHQLAEAGFFYTGVGDRVKCFSCGGGLKDWDDNDDPWEQHALWLSKCRFVKLIKGQAYMDAVIAKQALRQVEDKQINDLGNQESNDVLPSSIQLKSNNQTASVAEGNADIAPEPFAMHKSEKICASTNSTYTQNADNYERKNSMAVCSGTIPEEKLCKICYGAEYNTAFLPCGHVVACAKCASSVTKCPLCRKPFTDVMRVYFS